jgi:hypothetical protein
VSEELESSLQQAVESYLSERLHAIDEQLSRMQAEFNEAFARLRESSASETLEGTPVSGAITAHLQAARQQKLSGAASPRRGADPADVAMLKRAVAEIEQQQSQANVLSSLLTSTVHFAERVALFVMKNDQAIGWRVCEAIDPGTLEAIPSLALSMAADTVVSHAARSRSVEVGTPKSNSDDYLVTDKLGGQPQQVAAVPLVVRGKVVAVLYADSTSPEPGAVNLDALETLVRVAGMAVDLVSGARAAQSAPASESAPESEAYADFQPVERAAADEPAYTPQVEPQATEVYAETEIEETAVEPVADFVSEGPGDPIVEEVYAEPAVEAVDEEPAEVMAEEVSAQPAHEYVPAQVPEYVPHPLPDYVPDEHAAEEVSTAPADEAAVEDHEEPETVAAPPQVAPPASAPAFSSQYAAPLGSARRYGVAEPDLPIEVGEEERRLHNDARRFARLLVSEIKLYNEPKVKEGRSKSDIYDRLREDIDRSRQMYDKRVSPPVAARHDYFHQELVNTLAEGDPARLGASYPGAAVAVG